MKNKTIVKGRVDNDTITIYSNDPNDEMAFEVKLDKSTREITGKPRYFRQSEYIKYQHDIDSHLSNKIQILSSIIISLASIIIGLLTQDVKVITSTMYFVVFSWFNIYWALSFYFKKKNPKNPEYEEARLHGALHKVLNYYNTHKKIPTLEEAKKTSVISAECMSNVIFSKVILFTIASMLLLFCDGFTTFILLFTPTVILAFVSRKYAWFRFMQKLIIEEPDDDEIITAIYALTDYEAYNCFQAFFFSIIHLNDE